MLKMFLTEYLRRRNNVPILQQRKTTPLTQNPPVNAY